MRRIIEMLPCRRYWKLWGLTTVIAFGFFPETMMLPKTGSPKVRIGGGALGGLIPPQVGAPKARVGSGVRVNREQQGK